MLGALGFGGEQTTVCVTASPPPLTLGVLAMINEDQIAHFGPALFGFHGRPHLNGTSSSKGLPSSSPSIGTLPMIDSRGFFTMPNLLLKLVMHSRTSDSCASGRRRQWPRKSLAAASAVLLDAVKMYDSPLSLCRSGISMICVQGSSGSSPPNLAFGHSLLSRLPSEERNGASSFGNMLPRCRSGAWP